MDLFKAETIAIALIEEHLPPGWTFAWNNRAGAFGICNYLEQTIQLSVALTCSETEYATRQTILHEIAHAIAGPDAKHGPRWKAVARSIGVKNPKARRVYSAEPTGVRYRYLLVDADGNILRRYLRHPGAKFEKSLWKRQLKGRPETFGTLKLVKAA